MPNTSYSQTAPYTSPIPCIAILGRKEKTGNYEKFLSENGFSFLTTLDPEVISCCSGLLLPGGGDITPAFFGEKNKGSRQVDTELDILQLQALELCMKQQKPVLGICKGMQLINVAFGGTLVQDMPRHSLHLSTHCDLYHPVRTDPTSVLGRLYAAYLSDDVCVNSAHHQCVNRPGQNLQIIQYSAQDHGPEASAHRSLPILGLQWHPERLDPDRTTLPGALVLSLFRHAPNKPCRF